MNDIQKIKEFFSKPMEEAMDANDPVLMKARAAAFQRSQPKPEPAKPSKAVKNADKIKALKLKRAQLMRDMEQEAEPEGGPIADRYGRELEKIDKAIAMLSEAKKETAVDMAKKQLDALGVKYEMSKTSKVKPFKVIYKPINKEDDWYDKFEEIVDLFNLKGFVKQSMSEASSTEKFLRKLGWAGEDWTPQEFASQIKKLPDSTLISWAKSNKGIGKGIPNTPLAFQQKLVKIEMDKRGLSLEEAKEKYYVEPSKKGFSVLRNGNEVTSFDTEEEAKQHANKLNKMKFIPKEKFNEAKSEDKVDTITMDIPLFLRMLEYSREDASQDMDLHDVTEKANSLGKEKGILSMEDYDDIVGAAEDIEEATDYMKRRKAMDDYYVSKKDKPKKSTNPTPSSKTDYMKRREKDLAEAILAKLKK
jgi:hypothetical protein